MDNRDTDSKYEECIYFLADKLKENNNSSNTLIHSIRVGLKIEKDGYDANLVKAGFLHDIFEDTDIKISEFKKYYNDEITDLILSGTANYNIQDDKKILLDMYTRCLEHSKEALLLKCYDIEDKMQYYKNSIDKDVVLLHDYKYQLFLTMSKKTIYKYTIWKQMEKEYKECKKQWHKNGLIKGDEKYEF